MSAAAEAQADGQEVQGAGPQAEAEGKPGGEARARAKLRGEYGARGSRERLHTSATPAEEAAVSSSSSSSHGDICRICHMGPRSGSASSCSLDLGPLVSACRCRGSVGLVHVGCLERWLTESGHTRCELCGLRYATVRVPRHGLLRGLLLWLRTFVATRQMLLDSLYLAVTTPLAAFSAYVCAMTLKMALDNRAAEIPWSIVAMLPTCSLTLVAYWGWLLTLHRLHGRRWRQYWQSNFVVRLLPDRAALEEDDERPDERADAYQDDLYDDLPDLFNLM